MWGRRRGRRRSIEGRWDAGWWRSAKGGEFEGFGFIIDAGFYEGLYIEDYERL